MKALSKKRTIQKAAESEFEKYAQEYANHLAHANIALFLCLLQKWGCKPETIRKRYEDIKMGYELTELFGKQINDDDYIKQCKEQFGIDVTEIKVKLSIDYV